jgi:hypothetical protein
MPALVDDEIENEFYGSHPMEKGSAVADDHLCPTLLVLQENDVSFVIAYT